MFWILRCDVFVLPKFVVVFSVMFKYNDTSQGIIKIKFGIFTSLQWRRNERDCFSDHQPHDCLLNRLFRRRSKKYQSSPSLAVVRGIHRWPMNSPHIRPVTRKMFPIDDVIMLVYRYIHSSCYYHHQIRSINISHCYHIFPWSCVWDICYIIFCHVLQIHCGETGIFFIIIVQFVMSANSRIGYGLQIVFVCLYNTPSYYHHCANLSVDVELMKCLPDIFCRVCE